MTSATLSPCCNASMERGCPTCNDPHCEECGLPVEHEVEFGTLHPDGKVTNVRRIRQSDIGNCPHVIFNPEHYRPDRSCKCDDAEERAMMIREWGYEASDFEGPVRVAECHELGTGYHEGATCGSRGIRPPFMCPPCQREEANHE